jgi:hypothetical protein
VTVQEPRCKGNFRHSKPGSCYQATTIEDKYVDTEMCVNDL